MNNPNCGYDMQHVDVCRAIFMHELGHNRQAQMPPWVTRVFEKILNDRASAWETQERFADAWAACAMGATSDYFWIKGGVSLFGLHVEHRRMRRVCHLMMAS
ncbi:MAG: hypothetical protein JHC87_09345 [Thermoleophilaceae bacterium]|nr:hypothetical protein [Thermoleophilaceae bacterium]